MVFRQITIRSNILSYFLLIVAVVTFLLVGVQYHFSRKIAEEAVSRTFSQTAEKITLSIQTWDLRAKEILYKTVGQFLLTDVAVTTGSKLEVKIFTDTLLQNSTIYSVYIGAPNGDLFEVINMQESPDLYQQFQAPAAARWTAISVKNRAEGRLSESIFLDETLQVLSRRTESSDYFTNKRQWYQEAIKTDNVVRSDPYLFASLKANGITFSQKINVEGYVLAMDFTMPALRIMLQENRFSPSSELFLFGRDGSIISSSVEQLGRNSSKLTDILRAGETDQVVTRRVADKNYFAMISSLSSEFGAETYLGITVSEAEMLRPYMEKIFYSLGFALLSVVLSIPLIMNASSRIVRPINRLMVENRKIGDRKFSEVAEIETNIVELASLSRSQVMMAKSIQEYQDNQKKLMDSFIRLIANAIDAKSSYTGAHCKRVPIIATMLAQQAENCAIGGLKDFCFASKDEWDEFERGAWLHDCGKIVTPEYVVDKATKLETIHNRIHEIRTRFEVLWRDVDVDYYERLLKGEEKSLLEEWRKDQQQRLLNDFAFIAECNQGDELMTPEKKERLHAIAQRQWSRHFDNRLGLSEEELERCGMDHSDPLPATEKLIADRIEHIVLRNNFDEEAYRAEGFRLDPPEYAYNFGELYNLTIERGTLTAEERFKINEHAIMTLRMLKQLPYAPELEKLPEIAGSHHEMLNGHGYPRQLTREQLSIPARIIALADIFEALTATDRPYKKTKTLSETLKIMSFMVKDEHIDAELFALFLRSGVYLDYARTYLQSAQIDAVEIETYLS